MPDVDAKLVTALRQAKTTPMFFAFVAKGTNDGVLLVGKKTIPASDVNEAKKGSGGTIVYRGRCFGDEGKMVFELPVEPPASLAKQLKAIIHRDAGMTMQVETRVAADLAEQGEGENEGEGVGHGDTTAPVVGGTPPPPPPPPPPPQQDPAARFAMRLKALMPALQKAEATGNAAAQTAHQRIADANNFVRQHDYAQANTMLDQAEVLIKQALTTAPMAPPPAQHGSNVLFTQTRLAWDQTRKKIQADLQTLEKSILSTCLDPELAPSEFDFSTLAADTKTLYTILDNLDERLIDKLDDALNAADPQEKSRFQTEASKIVKEYLGFVEGDQLMKVIDENGFAPVAVRKSALDALHLLSSKL